jgi:hypothetical protein
MPANRLVLLLLTCLLAAGGCANKLSRELTDPRDYHSLDQESPYLKAHMQDGTVYVLRSWTAGDHGVRGSGERQGINRTVLEQGWFEFPLDSVAIFETNRVSTSGGAMALGILTAVSLGATVYCLSNEKACFGSCPTFYALDGDDFSLQAEGFSHAVSPSLEARDIDALYRATAAAGRVELRMTNEALETHVVREANLLVVPRLAGTRVFATGRGEFISAVALERPSSCSALEGDCFAAIEALDGRERYSEADSSDLATREIIDLEFDRTPPGELGIVIASRQTLLSTYLFYQSLAYMGTEVGSWYAALERGGEGLRDRVAGVGRLLGGIEVLVRDGDDDWQVAGQSWETGPLATDVRVVRLGRLEHNAGHPLQIRLRMTRGLWRLDQVALAQLGGSLEPIRLKPHRVLSRGRKDDEARDRLTDPERMLVTLPGDEYTLLYRLPDASSDYELFLESRGYYLEWMRKEWLAEEDPARAAMIFFDPAGALRTLAPQYKKVEPLMEDLFWRSRYVRQ